MTAGGVRRKWRTRAIVTPAVEEASAGEAVVDLRVEAGEEAFSVAVVAWAAAAWGEAEAAVVADFPRRSTIAARPGGVRSGMCLYLLHLWTPPKDLRVSAYYVACWYHRHTDHQQCERTT